MAATARVGLVGVGLMGLGIARNILKGGHALTFLDHPGNQPTADLLSGGAKSAATAADVARAADVLILCVTGTPQVEAVLGGDGGALEGLGAGAVVVDCSTAVPESTKRMAALVEAAGAKFIDAPMTGSAKHAQDGKLNLLVGGDADTLAAVRPVLSCIAATIAHAGPIGAGHRLKLLHNYVSLGTIGLLAEASACALRSGVSMDIFIEALSNGGGRGVALDRLRPYLESEDPSGLQFSMSNAAKDIGYYLEMARELDAPHGIADGVEATLDIGVNRLGRDAMVPQLVSALTPKVS